MKNRKQQRRLVMLSSEQLVRVSGGLVNNENIADEGYQPVYTDHGYFARSNGFNVEI